MPPRSPPPLRRHPQHTWPPSCRVPPTPALPRAPTAPRSASRRTGRPASVPPPADGHTPGQSRTFRSRRAAPRLLSRGGLGRQRSQAGGGAGTGRGHGCLQHAVRWALRASGAAGAQLEPISHAPRLLLSEVSRGPSSPRPEVSAARGLRPHHAAGQVSRGRSGGAAVRGGVALPAGPQLGSDAGPAGLAWRCRAGSAGPRSRRRRRRGGRRGVDGSGRRGLAPGPTAGRTAVRGRARGRGPCQGRRTANAGRREGRRAHPARRGTGAAPSTPWHC